MPIYHFGVTLAGGGDTPEEAWQDAVQGFSLDPGPPPDDDNIEVVDEEEP